MKFPVVGSCVLFGLFVVIKFVPKHWVDLIISLYFSAIGAYTIATLIEPATVHSHVRLHSTHVRLLGACQPLLVSSYITRRGCPAGTAAALAARQQCPARARPRVPRALARPRLADLHAARAKLLRSGPRLRRRLLQNQVRRGVEAPPLASPKAVCNPVSLSLLQVLAVEQPDRDCVCSARHGGRLPRQLQSIRPGPSTDSLSRRLSRVRLLTRAPRIHRWAPFSCRGFFSTTFFGCLARTVCSRATR